jgi:hypothetical protein
MVVVLIYRIFHDELAGFPITIIPFDTVVESGEP